MKLLLHWLLFVLFSFSLQAQEHYKAIDLSNFDTSVSPRDDFYRYVNGKWLDKTVIPASEGRWSSFNEVEVRNRIHLDEILKEAVLNNAAPKGSEWQMVRDFYISGMDTFLIQTKSYEPIVEELIKLEKAKDLFGIFRWYGSYIKHGYPTLFAFSIRPDAKNSRQNAAYITQSGLSLPDRSFYLESNERSKKIQQEFLKYVQFCLQRVDKGEKNADKKARIVLEIETEIAKISRERVMMRVPEKNYNLKDLNYLKKALSKFDWKYFFDDLKLQNFNQVIVGQPEYLEKLNDLLVRFSLEDWKIYHRFRIIHSAAPHLSSDFARANFDLFGKTINGLPAPKERHRIIEELITSNLTDAMGKLFAERAFKEEAKQKAEAMIINVKRAFSRRIDNLAWMGAETKKAAQDKLNAITYKIGYPDRWENYGNLDIKRDDFYNNLLQIRAFRAQKMLNDYAKEVDKQRWGMPVSMVNAYYSALNNEIVFPAGILQPPFFSAEADDAVNYGGIGAVIGHELTHGFDDSGSKYDMVGNLQNWWKKEDSLQFANLAGLIVEQFNNLKVLDSVSVNGKLTLGENIADLGGLAMAFDALELATEGQPKLKIDGFTPEQRFFISWAQVWRMKFRPEALLTRIKTDSHSPGMWRVNAPMSNMEQFFESFDVQKGDKMRRKDLIKLW